MSSMETRITAPNGAVYAVVWRKDRPQTNASASHDVYQITAGGGYRAISRRKRRYGEVLAQYLGKTFISA